MTNRMDFGAVGWMVSGLAAVALLCLWIWQKRWARRPDGPTCGQCGYDVRGLPSSVCPECGSDLKIVGIVEPGTTGRASVRLSVLYWTLLMAMISPFMIRLGVQYGPAYRHEEAFYHLVPKSGAYAMVHVNYWGDGVGRVAPVQTVKCFIDPPNKIGVILEVYEGGRTCKYPDMKWQPVRTAFDESAVLAAMRTGAVDTSSEQVKAEAAELCGILRGVADGSRRDPPLPTKFIPSAQIQFRKNETVASIRYAYLGLCIVIWQAGWWWIARREKQRKGRLAQRVASSAPGT